MRKPVQQFDGQKCPHVAPVNEFQQNTSETIKQDNNLFFEK
jgi:hypothetical protein